jgi:hypothetical protein
MLLCDICDGGYHMDCLNPPIYTVPLEEWYCPQCEAREEVSFNFKYTIELINKKILIFIFYTFYYLINCNILMVYFYLIP